MSPTPSMLDEWEEYLAIRDDEVRTRRGVEEYEAWHRREREEELEREIWLKKTGAEEARKAAEEEEAVWSYGVLMGEGRDTFHTGGEYNVGHIERYRRGGDGGPNLIVQCDAM